MTALGLKLKVPGRPPAKANDYRVVMVRGHPRPMPSKAVKEYEALIASTMAEQLRLLGLPPPLYPRPLPIELILVWHRGDQRRKDLGNIHKAIEDGLTKGGLWDDDEQVRTLLLHAVFDADGVDQEWVDIYVRPATEELSRIPSKGSSSRTASPRRTKKASASAI